MLRTRLALNFVWAVAFAAFATASPAWAQSLAPGAGAWNAGPAGTGDRTTLAGVIDVPANGATVQTASFTLSGWFVDVSAQGWTGVDDVEVFLGEMENGGRPLAHAQFQQNRPDVAAALKNPFWAPAGWSATVSTASLPVGPNTLSVYAHTPGKGWWMRQVSVTSRPATASPSVPVPALSPLGNDIAYPQCPTGAEPTAPAFALVGVNGGRPYTANPCLPRQFVWALTATSPNQTHVGFYLNTADPGPGASPNWPAAGTTTPRACDGTWSADCAYDYGWHAAQDAFTRASAVSGSAMAAQAPWWLDVESANSWSADMGVNSADVQGAVAYLHSVNVTSIGVYSTSTDWEALIGQPTADGPLAGLLNWRPGATSAQDAPAWCSRTVSGGRVKYVQFPNGGFDTDLACF